MPWELTKMVGRRCYDQIAERTVRVVCRLVIGTTMDRRDFLKSALALPGLSVAK